MLGVKSDNYLKVSTYVPIVEMAEAPVVLLTVEYVLDSCNENHIITICYLFESSLT
jgi:hypothetical protein